MLKIIHNQEKNENNLIQTLKNLLCLDIFLLKSISSDNSIGILKNMFRNNGGGCGDFASIMPNQSTPEDPTTEYHLPPLNVFNRNLILNNHDKKPKPANTNPMG